MFYQLNNNNMNTTSTKMEKTLYINDIKYSINVILFKKVNVTRYHEIEIVSPSYWKQYLFDIHKDLIEELEKIEKELKKEKESNNIKTIEDLLSLGFKIIKNNTNNTNILN